MKLLGFFALATSLCLVSLNSTAANKVYKWTDDEGVVQYTDQAPNDRDYSVVTATGAPPSAKRIQQQQAEQAPPSQAAEEVSEAQKTFEQVQQQRDELSQKIRQENCTSAQSNLKTLQEHSRIRIMGEDGQTRYLSEEERQAQIGEAEGIISTNCD